MTASAPGPAKKTAKKTAAKKTAAKKTAAKKTAAKKTAAKKTRLEIRVNVMRELMFASGGRCSMENCGLSLLAPSGGWVGTIAHIIGAEKGGPRGSGPESPEERRKFENLMLMCATHGREVDDKETGETQFPIEMLRAMKAAHEAKVLDAVNQAIDDEASGVRVADGLLDISLRPATASVSADGIAEALAVKAPAELVAGLSQVRSHLQRLSQMGLGALGQLLQVWLHHCYDHSDGGYDFGDPFGTTSVSFPMEKVLNRVGNGQDEAWSRALDELMSSDLLDSSIDEYDHDYVLREPWILRAEGDSFNFWIAASTFLYYGYGVKVSDWTKTLDFTIFDRVAAPSRQVPWR